MSVLLLGCAAAVAQERVPRIVNGTPTVDYASVGALLFYADPQRTRLDGLCSGTLVGCTTFVTAAHCVCDDVAEDSATCARLGLIDPATMRVYLQHAGFVEITGAEIPRDYVFAEAGDIAVLKLAQSPSGVAPSPINTVDRLEPGTAATLVGFGSTGGRSRDEDDAGLKREGPVRTSSCEPDVSGDTHICWRFDGEGSSTCSGDSGGPLFIDGDGGPVLAGTTSGGTRESCLAPDFSFDTDVFVYRAFVMEHAAEELGGGACDELPSVGEGDVRVSQRTGAFDATVREARFEVEVPEGAVELRIGMNGQLHGGSGSSREDNRYNLYVRAGEPPSRALFDCSDRGPSVFGFCRMREPQVGTWHVLVDGVEGTGDWQVTATVFTNTVSVCVGDCNEDSRVTVNELVVGIAMALGSGAAPCVSIDADGNGEVTVDEIVTAVSNALVGCG